ncbi:MAG: hypothetical protein AAGA68_18515 [Pseudomonadota bacterium]
MPNFLVPTNESTTEMLGMVFGEDTEIFEGSPVDPTVGYLATFVDDEGKLVAVSACDTQFGAFAGSALSLIPKAGAEDAIADGNLSKPMVDNLYEVMNLCTRLLMDEKTPHLKLGGIHPPGEALDDAANEIVSAGNAAHLKVDVPRYGMGNVSFFVS